MLMLVQQLCITDGYVRIFKCKKKLYAKKSNLACLVYVNVNVIRYLRAMCHF